jgi:hypothetical protein
MASLSCFLRFAVDVGALTMQDAERIRDRSWLALLKAGKVHEELTLAVDPPRLFLDLLASALATGSAHLEAIKGGCPDQPDLCGWSRKQSPSGTKWSPRGLLIGWKEGDHVYLEPNTAGKIAHAMDAEHRLRLQGSALRKQLHSAGFLASVDVSRNVLTVRKMISGGRRNVLHIRWELLFAPEPDQPDQAVPVPVEVQAQESVAPGGYWPAHPTTTRPGADQWEDRLLDAVLEEASKPEGGHHV